MTEPLHLSLRHRKELIALFRDHLPDVDVWAYGSRTNGQSHDGSDLDLVLRNPDLKKIPIDKLLELEEAIRDSRIPFIVEVVDWARVPERFHSQIKRQYVILISSTEQDEKTAPTAIQKTRS